LGRFAAAESESLSIHEISVAKGLNSDVDHQWVLQVFNRIAADLDQQVLFMLGIALVGKIVANRY
jgi:hypothetical protein